MRAVARTYAGARGAAGPLVFVENARGAILGETVAIEVPGQPPRRAQVIDAGEAVTVLQVLEDTLGLAPDVAALTFSGEVASIAVGPDLVGRILGGGGQPRDGLPPVIGRTRLPVSGLPLNPVRRRRPTDFIETGFFAIDGMNTLVRGQKLPVFAGPGLPGLELAALLVEHARSPRDAPFIVVFVALGITARESQGFIAQMERTGALERSLLVLNLASDPSIERLLAPRVGLTAAEYLAFEQEAEVLVVLADMTHYCEALRELGAARQEVPGRRGYPGYMYTDLASLFERAGIVEGGRGSLTQIPVLTMPDDDMTHPIPDLTGYITEGQIVLSRELHHRGVFPPIDVLPSLSRLMKAGIGAGHTFAEHRRWSNQLYALYARGREAREMAAIVGAAGLSEADARAVGLADAFEKELVHQGRERRALQESVARGWEWLERWPRDELVEITDAMWAARDAERRTPAPARAAS